MKKEVHESRNVARERQRKISQINAVSLKHKIIKKNAFPLAIHVLSVLIIIP